MKPSCVYRDKLTWLSDTDTNVSALELAFAQSQSLLQTVYGAKLNVTESFWSVVKFVLDQTHTRDIALAEETLDIAFCHFKGEVTQVGSVWWLVWKRKVGVVTRALFRVLALSNSLLQFVSVSPAKPRSA